MFGCLFTGTLLLSCIDRNPSGSSDFLARVVQCVGPVEKDIEVDTKGSFLSRLAGLAGSLGPSGGGKTCSGVKLLVLPGLNWRRSAYLGKLGLFWFTLHRSPQGALRLTALLANHIFLIMSSNTEKINSNCRLYFQELCEIDFRAQSRFPTLADPLTVF